MRPAESSVRAGAHCSSGWVVETPWHRHDMHQMLCAFNGSLVIESPLGRYKIPHQFAAFIPAGAAHRTSIQKVASGSVFISPGLLDVSAKSPRVITAPMLMRQMVTHAMRWPLTRTGEDRTSVAFFDCFARLCEEWVTQEVALTLPSSTDERIVKIMKFTHSHIATVTLADLSAAVGMSERSVRRHCAAELGISWEEYRQRLRIHLALDDLDGSRKSIGTIATDHGYDSQAAFARAFRSIIGESPSAYRRRNGA